MSRTPASTYDPLFSTEADDVFRGIFYGLGADGTVGANKNSIKIIGEDTGFYAQGYFVYDSKKSGSTTTSHLRFGPRPIHSTYLITTAKFVACHQWFFLEKFDVLQTALPGSTFLLNSMYGPAEVWDHLPKHIQEQLIQKKINFYVIDAYKVANASGMGGRVNTIMQTCFFAISGVLPRDAAIAAIKNSIKKTYGRKGDDVVRQNFEAVDQTVANLHEGAGAGPCDQHDHDAPGRLRCRAGFCEERDGKDYRRVRRRSAGEPHAGGRHIPHGYHAVGKAQHRDGNSGVGCRNVHPVQQMRSRLPPRGDPDESL